MNEAWSRFGDFAREKLFTRQASIIIGLLCIGALIWVAGPYVGLVSVGARLLAILVLVLLVAAVLGVRWWQNKRRGRRLERELDAAGSLGTRPDREAEIESLRNQMQTAIAALKSSELGVSRTGSAALYALPWYMIIGPSAAGKSTILRNSGLNFPHSSHDPRGVQGLGGTRNCDWWFSDEAIFLDTAGRYTAIEEDRDEWLAFLGMLRQHRKHRPVNGVIVAISIADLLTADGAGVEKHARIVRSRIDEIIGALGIVFPVYIFFTKCDLIRGFNAFFNDLSNEERDQIWGASALGVTQAAIKREPAGIMEQEFDLLYSRLCSHRWRKLSTERNPVNKGEILDFPGQFRAARTRLKEFVQFVFKAHPYTETPIFAGFFFTSGTQGGVAIERSVGADRRFVASTTDGSAGLARDAKPFFISRLLKEVVLPNSGLVTHNRRRAERLRALKRSVIVACFLVAITGITTFATSFSANVLLIHRTKTDVRRLASALTTSSHPERPVSALVSFERNTAPLWDPTVGGMRLYRPMGLEVPLGRSFLWGMQRFFLAPVKAYLTGRLEDDLKMNPGFSPSGVSVGSAKMVPVAAKMLVESQQAALAYTDLKRYLALAHPKHLVFPRAVSTYTALWVRALNQQGVATHAAEIPLMQTMVRYYLAHMRKPKSSRLHAAALNANYRLVRKVRGIVNRLPNAERLYADMQAAGSLKLAPIDMRSLLGHHAPHGLYSNTVIPGVYSRKGWRTFVIPYLHNLGETNASANWILGNGQQRRLTTKERRRLVVQMRRLYFSDYATAWLQMLETIAVRAPNSLSAAARQLHDLAKPKGAFTALLRGIYKNVDVSANGRSALLRFIAKHDSHSKASALVPELAAPFGDLRNLLRAGLFGKKNTWVGRYLKGLSTAQGNVSQLAATSDPGRKAIAFARRLMSGNGGSALNKVSLSVASATEGLSLAPHRALSHLLRAPIRATWESIIRVAERGLEHSWRNRVYAPYRQTIRGRYPFYINGGSASVSDVDEFFRRRSGIYWAFMDHQIKPFLHEKDGRWEVHTWLGIGVQPSASFLASITRTRQISQGFFAPGQSEASVHFAVFPYPTSGVVESNLQVGNKRYRYRNGPQEWHVLHWSGASRVARIQALRVGSMSRAALSYRGRWAWFHLLDHASIGKVNGDAFDATWVIGHLANRSRVTFRIRANRVPNPLLPGFVRGYELPKRIFRLAKTAPADQSDS